MKERTSRKNKMRISRQDTSSHEYTNSNTRDRIPKGRVVNPNPDPSVSQRYRYGSGSGSGSRSFYHQAKIVRQTLIPTVFCDFFTTFYLRKIMYMYR